MRAVLASFTSVLLMGLLFLACDSTTEPTFTVTLSVLASGEPTWPFTDTLAAFEAEWGRGPALTMPYG